MLASLGSSPSSFIPLKLLFTSDTHNASFADLRLTALARARGAALLAVAGDLLDVFGQHPSAQVHAARTWLKLLAAGVPHLAVCSGNHDPDGPNGAGWLARAAADVKAGNLRVDGAHAALREGDGGLVVTCCPYWNILERGVTHHHWLKDQAEQVWKEGRRQADEHRLPWVVLHHEPPEGSRVAAGGWEAGSDYGVGSFWCAEWTRAYRPDYLLCGHLHQSPFVAGGTWADRVEGTATWAFNPGRGEVNCRAVEIDTTARVARWFSTWDGELEDARALDGPASLDDPRTDAGVDISAAAEDDGAEWEIWLGRNRHRS